MDDILGTICDTRLSSERAYSFRWDRVSWFRSLDCCLKDGVSFPGSELDRSFNGLVHWPTTRAATIAIVSITRATRFSSRNGIAMLYLFETGSAFPGT